MHIAAYTKRYALLV